MRIKIKGFLVFLKKSISQLKYIHNWKGCYLIFEGFMPNKIYLYDFKKYSKKVYLSDFWRYVYTHEINKPFISLFNDKLNNYYFLRNFTNKVIPIMGYIRNNAFYPISGATIDNNNKLVILKSKNGWGGFGVEKAILNNNEFLNLDKKKIALVNYNNYIVTPLITNHIYARSIYPFSLNTIRVISACMTSSNISILAAIHRFGNKGTKYVDNFSSGGISANLDINSGVILSAFSQEGGVKVSHTIHPFTKVKLVGVSVPFWDLIKEHVLFLHLQMKYVKYIGWDIAVTDDNYVIVEANHMSDIDIIQVHYPLLLNNDIRNFYLTEFQ